MLRRLFATRRERFAGNFAMNLTKINAAFDRQTIHSAGSRDRAAAVAGDRHFRARLWFILGGNGVGWRDAVVLNVTQDSNVQDVNVTHAGSLAG